MNPQPVTEQMNRNNKKLKAQFAPDTRFAVVPTPAAPFRALHETELERLKGRLLGQALQQTDAEDGASLRRAADEAAALAWTTWYPLLLFPLLFAEKAELAARQAARQAAIRKRSGKLLTGMGKLRARS